MQPAKRLQPQPETGERRLHNPGLFDLSRRDLVAILKRAGRSALADQITDSAAALAYYTFLSIPATLLVALGVFGLVASPSDVSSLMDHLRGSVPSEAITLLRDSLTRINRSASGHGRGFRSTPLVTLKSVEAAPTPRAIVSTATAVKPGSRRRSRRP